MKITNLTTLERATLSLTHCSSRPSLPIQRGAEWLISVTVLMGFCSALHFYSLAEVLFTPLHPPACKNTAGSNINTFCFSKKHQIACFLSITLPGITVFILFFRGVCPRVCHKVFLLTLFPSLVFLPLWSTVCILETI